MRGCTLCGPIGSASLRFSCALTRKLSRRPHGRRRHGIGAVPGRRPIFGPMTSGIELAEGIEQAQILVIVNARDVFADRTAQRHYAQPLRPQRDQAGSCLGTTESGVRCSHSWPLRSKPSAPRARPAQTRIIVQAPFEVLQDTRRHSRDSLRRGQVLGCSRPQLRAVKPSIL